MRSPLLLLASAACAVGLALAPSVAHADTKIAVIDMQRAISETNEGSRATDSLKKLFDKRQVELDDRQKGMLKEKQDLEKKCKNMPREQCDKGMEELQRKLVELQQLMMQYQQEIQKKQGEATQPILGKMLGIVKRIALDKGYDIVVDRGAAHFERADLDVTDIAIKMYNTESGIPPLTAAEKGDTGKKPADTKKAPPAPKK